MGTALETVAPPSDAFGMMAELVLENGSRWGDVATDFQLDDASAVFSPDKPHMHFLTRPRGASKTTDIAGVALAWLTMEAPPLSNGHVVASNKEQASILIEAAAAFVLRTPELDGTITLESERLVAPNGAWVRVLSQSDSGAWGLRDAHLLILDEFAQWPETRGAKRVYEAIRSTVQKVPGCRLVILTSAGEPSHWSRKILEQATVDPMWHVSETPGPVPWQDAETLESLRISLSPSAFERLVMNVWSESEERAIRPEDYEAAREHGFSFGSPPAGNTGSCTRLHHPVDGVRYVVTVDVGIINDATVICVAHAEPLDPANPSGVHQVVVDHLERWVGSKLHPIQVGSVEDRVSDLAREYGRARVYADRDQFVGNLQNLNRRGVHAEEWPFTATSVGQVASALCQTFRNRQIRVPHTPMLQEELLKVKLRESAPGVTRLDHARGAHDDQAVCIGLACHLLLGSVRGFSSARQFLEATQEAESIVESRRNDVARAVSARRGTRQTGARCTHRWTHKGARCVFCGDARTAA